MCRRFAGNWGLCFRTRRFFRVTLIPNIVGLSSGLTIADAWKAAELAGLAEDIENMPMGMHTMISEGGGGLSSGQRQRLIIALGSPDIRDC